MTKQNTIEKITPIRRKGCRNVGWKWEIGYYEDGTEYREKVIVPLHKGKKSVFISKIYKKDDFYGDGMMEKNIIDRFKYKGRGRPRKDDYSSVIDIQKKINTIINNSI